MRLLALLASFALVASSPERAFGDEPSDKKADAVTPGDGAEVDSTTTEVDSTTTEVDGLPSPLDASGIVVEQPPPSRLWWIPRALLFVPKLAVIGVLSPIRGIIYLDFRYKLLERAERLFFNDAKTFGIYPTVGFREGFGVNVGARLVHRDMFGEGESLSIRGVYGGRYDSLVEIDVETGDRLSKSAELQLGFRFDRRPRERFFGIGNGDLRQPDEIMPPIDPRVNDTAVATRYREDDIDIELAVDAKLGRGFATRLSTSFERREFAESEQLGGDEALVDIYDPAAVPGYEETLDSIYSELELRYDTRRPGNRYIPEAVPSDGWLLAGRVGINVGIDSDRTAYRRYTVDLERFIDLYDGSRTLALRVLASQLDAEIEEIPFVYLPKLGGDTLLRGYRTDRFRDRGVTMASVDYNWEIAPRFLTASVFTDVGRTQQSLWDPEFDKLRVGFGFGIQLHTLESFIARAHIASSSDGGVFINADFKPVINARIRE